MNENEFISLWLLNRRWKVIRPASRYLPFLKHLNIYLIFASNESDSNRLSFYRAPSTITFRRAPCSTDLPAQRVYSSGCWYLFNPRENAEQRVYRRLMTSELTFESRWSVYRIDSRTLDPANSMAEIYTNLDQTESTRTRMSGTFYWRGLFVAPIFRFPPCVRAHTRFPIFHLPDRIVPFAPPSGAATLPAFATRSPISPSRSHAIPRCFSTDSNTHPSLTTLPPSSYTTLPRLSSICRAASRHPIASVIPSANLCATRADSRFAKRIQRARVICFPVNLLLARRSKLQKKIYEGF